MPGSVFCLLDSVFEVPESASGLLESELILLESVLESDFPVQEKSETIFWRVQIAELLPLLLPLIWLRLRQLSRLWLGHLWLLFLMPLVVSIL